MKISTQMKTKWMQFKVSALSASVTALIVSGIPTQISASDIDIYQAGGTGGVNIYFMLDASASMESMSLNSDYGHSTQRVQKCAPEEKSRNVTIYVHTTSSNGNRIYYKKESGGAYTFNSSTSRLTYVGAGNGTHNVKSTFSTGWTRTDNNNKYESKNIIEKYTENVCTTVASKNICPSNNYNKLTSNLTYSEYIYAEKDDSYCRVNLNDLTDHALDVTYGNKIKKICEQESTGSTFYRCLTRLSILKKGLYSVIFNPDLNEDIYFALGTYKGSSATTHPKFLDDSGKVKFRSMDDDGKEILAKAIQDISTGNGTPIAEGFNEAALSHYNKVNFSSKGNISPECSGNGVYLLTDGVPQSSGGSYLRDNEATPFKLKIYNDRGVLVETKTASEIPQGNNPQGLKKYWRYLGGSVNYVAADKAKNIKTATVGFGGMYYKNFDEAQLKVNSKGNFDCTLLTGESGDLQSLCYLGEKRSNYGKGGFYTAQSTDDLVDSIQQFVSDVSVEIEGSTMGTNTIPVDALNPTQLQNYSYFPMFKPIVGGDEQLWAGNLKKFAVKTSSGTIVDQSDKPVFKAGKIQEKLSDYWYDSAGSSDDDVYMAWGGLLSKLKVNKNPLDSSGNISFKRKIYLDQNGDLQLIIHDSLDDDEILENKKHYLFGLLGYSKLTQTDFNELEGKSFADQLNYLETKNSAQDFQMGSVIHSTPIMLTQRGVFEEQDGEYGITEREDYILAGTTQGLVQVVDADSGEEVFSFLPSEFLTRTNNSQEKGFAESLAMSRFTTTDTDNFFYGVDGPWVAHTEYEYEFDNNKETMIAKKQYAYGGLRMGGRSYYALDLSDLGKASGKPKLLFSIKPDDHDSGPLSYMGESWSKPVITYIPWKGQKKLAMIVGGGYDRLYEKQLSNNALSGNVDGNGIYIFDAENGDLLWWGSSDADGNTSGTTESTTVDKMTHSIPSRVKAVDRNGDGITDHLYVGDLGGQVFRVDFNSKLGVNAVNTPLVKQAVKIADLNDSNGTISRRFYEAPTFTIHKDDNGKRFAMVTLASGDRSSPLSTETNYPTDYIVAIKDDTVTQATVTAPTVITLNSMLNISTASVFNKATHKGWFYPMPKSDGKQLRGIEEGIAIDNDLYYSVFNPDASTAKEEGGADDCTGGVTGKSIAYKFCLPYGDKTCFGTTTSSNPEKIAELGAGIIGLTFGAGRTQANHRTLIFNKDVSPAPPEYAVSDKLVPKRWFEYLPFNSGGE